MVVCAPSSGVFMNGLNNEKILLAPENIVLSKWRPNSVAITPGCNEYVVIPSIPDSEKFNFSNHD